MGYAFLMGPCAACGITIAYNPRKVPSVRVEGERRALCRSCVERWQKLHPDTPFTIPEGAYEPVDEAEL